jgi:chemotaxis protein methyltransferase CheR
LSAGPYVAGNIRGLTHYRKSDAVPRGPIQLRLPEVIEQPPAAIDQSKAETSAELPAPSTEDHAKLQQAAQRLANSGRLAEALECCDGWVAADRLNPSGHYLRAVILQERGAIEDAVASLRGALYLDPDFVLAHFVLGNIERNRGRRREAEKHLENARRLLGDYCPDDVLPESEGVSVRRFTEIVNSLLQMEAAA